MVVLEVAIGAIISALINKGITDIETKKDENNNTIIMAEGKKVAKLDANISKTLPLDFVSADLDRITSVVLARPDVADYEFLNPFDKDVSLINLGLVGNANFYQRGLFELKINGVRVWTISNGDLQDALLDEFPISKDGFKLKRNEKLEARLWSSDGSSVSMTILPIVAGYL